VIADYLSRVSLVIPTYNCGELLDRHLNSLLPMLGRFGQVILVDSFSTDGSYERAMHILKPYNATLYQRERGLYESWNCALSLVKCEYVLISTVGDSVEETAFEAFVAHTIEAGVDIAISPPEFYRPSGTEPSVCWPIHTLLDDFRIDAPVVVDGALVSQFAEYCFATAGLASLSGSFASNLVRIDLLQQHPFPTQFSGAGDVAWFALVCDRARVLIYPYPVAKFCLHGQSYPSLSSEGRLQLYRFVQECEAFRSSELMAELIELEEVRGFIRNVRTRLSLFYILNSDVHRCRARKHQLRDRIFDCLTELRLRIQCKLKESNLSTKRADLL